MASEDYKKAQKMGQRSFRACVSKGQYPYLQVLDDILENTELDSTQPLGVVNIPLDAIVGTKTEGRKTAFARNFMPLLGDRTEFAVKWSALCESQMEEGIRDPIEAVEFLNRFYVVEGNKRVSVMKYFGAGSIPGNVTRYIPKRNGSKEVNIYYEFLDFYKLTQINLLWFTEEGRFAKFVAAVGKAPGERWSDDDKSMLTSMYYRFRSVFVQRGGDRLPITPADGLLAVMGVYPYRQLCGMSMPELQQAVERAWSEVLVLTRPDAVELSMEPAFPQNTGLFSRLHNPIAFQAPSLKVGFVYEKSADTSAWTYAHDFGRGELEEHFGGRVTTLCYDNVQPDVNGDEILEKAVADGCDVIFTTTPKLIGASLKASLAHPEVKIINCSLNMSHPSIRTYYGRIHEAKFLLGAIAGALADDNKIGYVATYPTYGMIAAINAFALGAQMTNPRAQVYLEWTSEKGADIPARFAKNGVTLISDLDNRAPQQPPWKFGLYRLEGDHFCNYAMPFWNWGEFYVRIVQSIMNGGWSAGSSGERALNYWWGMDAGVIDVLCSRTLPVETQRLVNLLRQAVCSRDFDPFAGVLYAQDGRVVMPADHSRLTAEQVITMDWLASNVIGRIPRFDELIDEAKPLVSLIGVHKDETTTKIL
ncbi:BMP family ABC transporter substrate-binding protein [Allofournierella massiliensis]|uniref:Basic membrane lipoprotein Med (Substrate-binding protein (PBP1-ABC) superfamily) n=1 Tax=Allofournierella massiliensis TaxID=1650663 RepID=A0A4V2QAW2_9FIRM|nr:BMP family ABC transporter substrate-binding protein [Fournierella massiliensis]TCL54072.1 basic membrane lipoprotein Med (substrate-binding protein (PBP1-ABC) superfamily) [Fournierella massiliensis]